MVLLRLAPEEAVAGRGCAAQERPADARGAVRAGTTRLEELGEPLVRDVTRGGEDDVRADVRAAVVAAERAGRDARDHLGPADHRPSERMTAEDGLGGEVVHEVLRVVVHHRDLLEHDLALGVDVVEGGCEDHVGHRVERLLDPPVGDARVHDGRLARRRGVELPAHPVEELGDLLRGVARRALEEQVLDEVRQAGARGRLVPGAGRDPEPERHRAHPAELLGRHALAPGQGRDLGLGHGAMVTAPYAEGASSGSAPPATGILPAGTHPL